MKSILLIFSFLAAGCASVNRLADRIELSHDVLWDVYTEARVIDVAQYACHQRVIMVAGSPFPKYAFQYNEYFDSVKVGDIIPLTDSLRGQIKYKHNWKRL